MKKTDIAGIIAFYLLGVLTGLIILMLLKAF